MSCSPPLVEKSAANAVSERTSGSNIRILLSTAIYLFQDGEICDHGGKLNQTIEVPSPAFAFFHLYNSLIYYKMEEDLRLSRDSSATSRRDERLRSISQSGIQQNSGGRFLCSKCPYFYNNGDIPS